MLLGFVALEFDGDGVVAGQDDEKAVGHAERLAVEHDAGTLGDSLHVEPRSGRPRPDRGDEEREKDTRETNRLPGHDSLH